MFGVVLFIKSVPHLDRVDDRDRPVVPVLDPHDAEQAAVHEEHDEEPGVQHGQAGQQFGEGGPGLREWCIRQRAWS